MNSEACVQIPSISSWNERGYSRWKPPYPPIFSILGPTISLVPGSPKSHEPRVKTRGMHERRPQSTPACLGFSAARRRNALSKHFKSVPMEHLQGEKGASRASLSRRQGIYQELTTRRAVPPAARPSRHVPPNHYWIVPIYMLSRRNVHNTPAVSRRSID